MNDSLRSIRRLVPIALCVFILPFCTLIIQPWVQLGIVDDWSYIRSAQVLADTGHVVYNGWAVAMLGWQLYLGALFIKLLGFSFTAPRMATLLVAVLTAGLLQRLYVRLGLREWTSAVITLIFVCSPVFLAVTFSFMSDVYGVFVLVVCSYCCVRALQAQSPNAATVWICAAALLTGLGGSARQIAWLGVLIMVPCTLWLLRRNRRALIFGGPCTLLGMAMVPAFLAWFQRQTYSVPESIFPKAAFNAYTLLHITIPYFIKMAGFELFFLAAPLLVLFLPASFRNRRARIAMTLVFVYWILRLAYLHHIKSSYLWEVPYLFNSFWYQGWEMFPAYIGSPVLLLTDHLRHLLTVFVLAGELAFFGLLATPNLESRPTPKPQIAGLTLFQLTIVFLPFTLAYLLLLLPRLVGFSLLDRYLLFPELLFLGVAALLYQNKISGRLPAIAFAVVALYAVVNSAGLHDTFNLFRAQATLLDRLQSAGFSRTELDGGFQFNGWTQIVTAGSLNDPRIRVPANFYHPTPMVGSHDPCHTNYLELTPVVRARLILSFDPNTCQGHPIFKQSYATWLGPRTQTLYAVEINAK